MKKALKVIGIGVGILFVGFVALMFWAVSSEPEVEKVGATVEPTTEEDVVDETAYKVGDVVSIEGLELTITSAKITSPDSYTEPEKGKVLTLELNVNNGSDYEEFIDNTDFSLYDSEGNKLESYYGYDESAITDTVHPGKKLSGKLFFDVPEGESYELIYSPYMEDIDIVFDIVPAQ